MALSDTLKAKRERIRGIVNLMAENIVRWARDVYAPKGANWPATNSLAKGIVALKARRVGRVTEATIVSTARSKKGFDYATIQHEKQLAHVTFMPRSTSFVDFGNKGNREQRYRQGYAIGRRGAPKYKSKYLERAAAAAASENLQILRAG